MSIPKDIVAFRSSLMRWYSRNGRDLPWRRTRDPYPILVSEFMLQQTQVATVVPCYNQWLKRFPNLAMLARASQSDVLHAWQGLGYYARARNLRATAKAIIGRHHGRFPKSIDQMQQLPGIGKYTAHAIATFAFDQPVPIVEANTARVLTRLVDLRIPIDSGAGRKILWNRAAQLLPKRDAAHFNSALIDLGALVCFPRKPKCEICPVKRFCRAINPGILPLKKAHPRTRRLTENHVYVVRQNKVLLERSAGRWRGMWILPPLKRRSRANGPIHTSIFPFTNHRITLNIFPKPWHQTDKRSQRWFAMKALDSIPLPAPHRRAINSVLSVGR